MPKLKNVTAEELQTACDAAQDIGQQAAFLIGRAATGYIDEIATPIQLATAFMGASAALADLARLMLMKATLQEQKAELERTLRSRA